MKYEHKGYIVKISFVGDPTTPIYRFKVYKPRKRWFPTLAWEARVHIADIDTIRNVIDKILLDYEKDKARWKW